MTTFPQTATLGHAAVYPARPIPPLHELRPVRKSSKRADATTRIHSIACSHDEFLAVCEFLAERRIGGVKPADKRPALPRHKAK